MMLCAQIGGRPGMADRQPFDMGRPKTAPATAGQKISLEAYAVGSFRPFFGAPDDGTTKLRRSQRTVDV